MFDIISPNDYIDTTLIAYPSLYASPSFDLSKFQILDQTFNVIGNGIDSIQYFKRSNTDTINVELVKLLTSINDTDNQLMQGYEKYETVMFPKNNSIVIFDRGIGHRTIVPISYTHKYPNITKWDEIDFDLTSRYSEEANQYFYVPYPNFGKTYSLVWRGFVSEQNEETPFKALGNEWIDAAIWYYEECLKFFNNEHLRYYYRQTAHLTLEKSNLESWQKVLFKYDFDNPDSCNAFLTGYGVSFIGDKHNFEDVANLLESMWNRKLKIILEFIDETLNVLK